MNLFKKTWSIWTIDGKRVPKGTPGATLTRNTSKKWHVSIDKKHIPLHGDKKVAREMAAQLLGKKAAGTLGVVVSDKDDDRRKPLAPLTEEWGSAVGLKGTSADQVALLLTRVRKVIDECGFVKARDMNGETAYKFVGGLDKSAQTRNFYLSALKQFARWLVKKKVLSENPFEDLEPWDVKKDRRHDRRELAVEELVAVISTTEEGNVTRAKMSGIDRAMLYRTAVFTGLRSAELGSLTPENFDLENAEVMLTGKFTKNGDPARQPLPPTLVPLLRDWLKARPVDQPCWPGPWAKNKGAGKMLKKDLEAAGVAYVKNGLFADFHSLRHSYISTLIRSGTNLKVAQVLARHSTITLTADRYGHLQAGEARAAVAGMSLPSGCMPDACEEAEPDGVPEIQGFDEATTGLENRRRACPVRGFESHSLRFFPWFSCDSLRFQGVANPRPLLRFLVRVCQSTPPEDRERQPRGQTAGKQDCHPYPSLGPFRTRRLTAPEGTGGASPQRPPGR